MDAVFPFVLPSLLFGQGFPTCSALSLGKRFVERRLSASFGGRYGAIEWLLGRFLERFP